jgi:hypothetical protein
MYSYVVGKVEEHEQHGTSPVYGYCGRLAIVDSGHFAPLCGGMHLAFR